MLIDDIQMLLKFTNHVNSIELIFKHASLILFNKSSIQMFELNKQIYKLYILNI